jgi:hypothetical protein
MTHEEAYILLKAVMDDCNSEPDIWLHSIYVDGRELAEALDLATDLLKDHIKGYI